MAEYAGVNNVTRKIVKEYAGVNNVARMIVQKYAGVNNVARKVYSRDIKKDINWTITESTMNADWANVGNTFNQFLADGLYYTDATANSYKVGKLKLSSQFEINTGDNLNVNLLTRAISSGYSYNDINISILTVKFYTDYNRTQLLSSSTVIATTEDKDYTSDLKSVSNYTGVLYADIELKIWEYAKMYASFTLSLS